MKGPTEPIVNIIENIVNNSISKSALKISKKLVHGRSNNKRSKSGGIPIVLTASAIEMSDFNINPFIAFSGLGRVERGELRCA
jgi:hypothetical protein